MAACGFTPTNPDQIAIVNQTDDLAAYWSAPGDGLGAALFAMADLATIRSVVWLTNCLPPAGWLPIEVPAAG